MSGSDLGQIPPNIWTPPLTFILLCSDYMASGWCMEEFRIAHHHVLNTRKQYLIPLLLQDLNRAAIDPDLEMYLTTHTYIEVQEDDQNFVKR